MTENQKLKIRIEELENLLSDYREVDKSHKKNVRLLDQLLNGENAAPQASLCDIVGQVKKWLEDGTMTIYA